METVENLCLDFGCQGEKEFCKGLSLLSNSPTLTNKFISLKYLIILEIMHLVILNHFLIYRKFQKISSNNK